MFTHLYSITENIVRAFTRIYTYEIAYVLHSGCSHLLSSMPIIFRRQNRYFHV